MDHGYTNNATALNIVVPVVTSHAFRVQTYHELLTVLAGHDFYLAIHDAMTWNAATF